MLHVVNASKSYGGEMLFEDLSLEVPAGSAVALVGPNGSGKSTFLRGVLGTEPFDPPAVTEAALHELRLLAAADRMPATLSSGQRRRLSFGTWLVRPRRVLILDEPEQRLDSEGRDWLTGRLLAERAAGTAILFASHDTALIDHVADDVLRISR